MAATTAKSIAITSPKAGSNRALASEVVAAGAAEVELGCSVAVVLASAEVPDVASELVLEPLVELDEVLMFLVFSAPAVTSTAMAVGRLSPLNVAVVVPVLTPLPDAVPVHTACVVPANLQSTICFLKELSVHSQIRCLRPTRTLCRKNNRNAKSLLLG